MEEKTNPQGKLPWQKPEIIEVNMQRIREEEMENFLRAINNEELFLRMTTSSPDR